MNSRPWRVIIVDDNEMNRDMLARRLERKGYVIAVAEGARDLEKRVKDEAMDLVLLDIEMPEITGLDALRSLRESYSPTQLPIIMVTAEWENRAELHFSPSRLAGLAGAKPCGAEGRALRAKRR